MSLQHCSFVFYFPDFGLPSTLKSESKNPHCLYIRWKKASGPVTGYRVYCFPEGSQKAEIVKDIFDVNQVSAIISGLKPEAVYRVGISSVSAGTESKLVYSEEKLRMRKFIKILGHQIYFEYTECIQNMFS